MLYLASQSPRRKQLLEQLGVHFELVAVDVPEARAPNESAEDYIGRVAREKATAGFELASAKDANAIVLGADTEVVLGDRVFGKPRDAVDAAAMLRALAGHTHKVISTVWCVDATRRQTATGISEVRFARMTDPEIEAYIAGGYAIQGRAAAFIEHLSGSYSGVMGLPLHETRGLLRLFDVHV